MSGNGKPGMATSRAVATVVLRVAAAGLTAAMAGIHLHLWASGYRDLDTIGALFLFNGVAGFVLAVALLVTPTRWLGVVAAVTALFTAGTLGALFLSLTTGLFGFEESPDAELVRPTLGVETAGVIVLTTLAVATLSHHHHLPRLPHVHHLPDTQHQHQRRHQRRRR
ncbi:hypothetical protein RGF97_24685 [Streptomyces roseicoloratus]|uniref:Integral membrane protein n=1 Tax=Streptomyces roseicoloratus TaxID=2508722 RepID=A0ABY9RYY3_9ACTN|nr:hypothetical protein [Streptomyces roseicoloratus]WMX47381.1 hypothetical protein RGF97_24685 [Streptomyces roseicoloratus]